MTGALPVRFDVMPLLNDDPLGIIAGAGRFPFLVADGAREGATFMRIAEGHLMGRPAVAGLLSGALVFLVAEEMVAAQAA